MWTAAFLSKLFLQKSPVYFALRPSVFFFGFHLSLLLHHLFMLNLHSYFLLSLCFALRCCRRSELADPTALVLFVHLLSRPPLVLLVQIPAALSVIFLFPNTCWVSAGHWGFWIEKKKVLIDCCLKTLYFPCQKRQLQKCENSSVIKTENCMVGF